ncbi:MAG: sialidase family protein [Planctomycetota bacterium]
MANGLRCVLVFLVAAAAVCVHGVAAAQDWRDITTGLEVPSIGYADQPFVVTLNDGSWLCVLTTGPGEEGATGQHVVTTRSSDRGETWSALVAIEKSRPTRGYESSWAVPLHVAHQGSDEFGRVYVFYVFNGEPVLEVPNRKPDARLDTLGWYMYRFSDDGGATWSPRRRIRIPVTQIDRRNTFGGRTQMFWGTSEPVVLGERVLIAFSKIRVHVVNETEGWVLVCDNLLGEEDMSRHEWRLVPSGNEGPERRWTGLRSDELFGDVQSEHSPIAMSTPGHVYLVNRTDRGVISHSISRDFGETWSEPAVVTYADGRPIRHPRANTKVWAIGDGRYLLWHHNHGGTGFEDRNPAWLSGGVERDGTIAWGEPEILLYDRDPTTRISYPDLVMEDGRYWIFETQKSVARLHEIPAGLIEGLFDQFQEPVRMDDVMVAGPSVFDLSADESFSIELRIDDFELGLRKLLAECGDRWSVRATDERRLVLALSDGSTTFEWTTDPLPVDEHGAHSVVFVIDGSAGIVTVIADGTLQDGRGERQFGWGRLPATLSRVGGGTLESRDWITVHGRALTTAEAVGNTRAGVPWGEAVETETAR